MTTIIAFTGKAGSGKDTAAKIMQEQMLQRDPTVKTAFMSFASPIKKAVAAILGCDVGCFDERKFKEGSLLDSHGLDTSPRQMMQLLGDEYGRQMISEDIWIQTAHNTLMDLCEVGADFVFITDLRYDNEQAWVLDAGGIVINVERFKRSPVATHASENGLSKPPCHTIRNYWALDDLSKETLIIAHRIQDNASTHRTSIDDCSPSEWDKVAKTWCERYS